MLNVREFSSIKSIPDDFNGMVSLRSKYYDDEYIIYDCKNGVLTEIPEYDHINDTPKLFTGKCFIDGSLYYFKKDRFHREDGPAIECSDGRKEWRIDNKLHRVDGPAIEYADGSKFWYQNNKLHRTDGPALEYADGYKAWLINDKYHRLDGPAFEHVGGTKYWYKNGQLHRLDGPACEYATGIKSWHIKGISYSEEEFNKKAKALLKKAGKQPMQEESKSFDKVPAKYTGKNVINDNVFYYKNGKFHREDGPAVENVNGDKYWYLNGKHHREDGPAVENVNGDKYWYLNGKHHREDGPACEYANSKKEWFINGKHHREDGPAVEWTDGTKEWLKNGKFHREDGPAIEHDSGRKDWFIDDKRHRLDGPAIEYAGGGKEWWIKDKQYTEAEFNKKVSSSKEKVKSFYSLSEVPKNYTGKCKVNNLIYYFKNGKYHREDGPAIELADGTKAWYLNDKRHRLDGPAVEWVGGNKQWYIEGKLYSEEEFTKKVATMNMKTFQTYDDVPKDFTGICEVKICNEIRHYKDGKLHREDGPAAVNTKGDKAWLINNKRHRLDGPAIEYANGNKEWFIEGESYSEKKFLEKTSGEIKLNHYSEVPKDFTGKCLVFGDIYYFKNGNKHREDGPAVELTNGYKAWWIHGKRHREDGPAIEYAVGDKCWYLDGKCHREDGPAIEYAVGDKCWYLDGNHLSEKDFKKLIQIVSSKSNKESKVNMSVKSTKQLVINSAKESTYRIAAEQISQTVRAALTLALSQVSSLETANMILSTDAGKALIQASLSLALNQVNIENKHLEKIFYELLVSSISTGEGFILDKIIGEVMSTVNSSINSIAPLPVATRIAQPTFAQEEEEEAAAEAQVAYV